VRESDSGIYDELRHELQVTIAKIAEIEDEKSKLTKTAKPIADRTLAEQLGQAISLISVCRRPKLA
jgi:hypothetical protein